MPNYSGHAPGHVRRTFLDAVEAYPVWELGDPEPTVDFEVDWVPRAITISAACGLVWNCTDILPGISRRTLEDCSVVFRGCTYAAAAQALLSAIKRDALNATVSSGTATGLTPHSTKCGMTQTTSGALAR